MSIKKDDYDAILDDVDNSTESILLANTIYSTKFWVIAALATPVAVCLTLSVLSAALLSAVASIAVHLTAAVASLPVSVIVGAGLLAFGLSFSLKFSGSKRNTPPGSVNEIAPNDSQNVVLC